MRKTIEHFEIVHLPNGEKLWLQRSRNLIPSRSLTFRFVKLTVPPGHFEVAASSCNSMVYDSVQSSYSPSL